MSFDDDRLTGLGGSDAAAALGISPWQTPYDLYQTKLKQAPPLPSNEQMHWGTLLEPVIREEYCRRTGRSVETPPMLRHPVHQFMTGHIDGWVTSDGMMTARIVEIKTARTAHGWGEPGSDEIPLQYLTQVHHYLVVSGAKIADVAVLIGGSDCRLYEVHADADIARELVREELLFWQRVERRDPPGPTNLRDALRRWGWMTAAGTVVAGEVELFAVERLHQIKAAQKQLQAEAEEAQLAIEERLGERGDLLVDEAGTLLASWKLDKGRKSYTVAPRPPSRRFLLKGTQDG